MSEEKSERQKQTTDGTQMPERFYVERIEAAPTEEGPRELSASPEELTIRVYFDTFGPNDLY